MQITGKWHVVILCTAFAFSSSAGEELLPNPGLEAGPEGLADSWSIHTWQPYGAGWGSGKIIDTDSAGKSSRCFQASASHPLSQVYLDRRNMPAKENTRYNLAVSVKPRGAMAPDSRCFLQCTFLDEKGKRLPPGTDPYLGSARTEICGFSDKWVRIGFSTVSPAGTKFINVTVRQIGIGKSLFDDLSMTTGEPEEKIKPHSELWQNGSAKLLKDASGKYSVLFRVKNTTGNPLRNFSMDVCCSTGIVGKTDRNFQVEPGETLKLNIPLAFPKEFSSEHEEILLTGFYKMNGKMQKAKWMFVAEIGSAAFDELLKSRNWGIQENFPGNKKGNPEFCGLILSDGLKDDFFSRLQTIPLEEKHKKLSLLFQIDSSAKLYGDLTLQWEFLDYFSRSETGKISFHLPKEKTAVLKTDLSGRFLNILKKTILDSNSVHSRIHFSVYRRKEKVSQKELSLNFKENCGKKFKETTVVPRSETLPLYGNVRLVDEIICGDSAESSRMREGGKGYGAKPSSEPIDYYGGSNVLSQNWKQNFREKRERFSNLETILGKTCRTTSDWGWFAYLMGGRNITPGKYYLLSIEYPCDISRNTLIYNGFHPYTNIGFHTGESLGDPYTRQALVQKFSNPLSGKYEFHETVFRAERKQAWISIHSMGNKAAPFSKGTALRAIRIYELGDQSSLEKLVPQATEPEGLPHRTIGYLNEDYLPTESDLLRYRFFGYNSFAPLLLMYCGGSYETNGGQIRWKSKLFNNRKNGNPAAKRNPNYYRMSPACLEQFIEKPENKGIRFFAGLEYGGTGMLPECAYARTPEGRYQGYLWGKRELKEGISIDMAHPEVGRDMARLVTELAETYAKKYPNFQGVVFSLRFKCWQVGYGMDSLHRFAEERNLTLPRKDPGLWVKRNHEKEYLAWHYREKRKNFLMAADALHKVRPDLKLVISNYNAGDDNLHFGRSYWNIGLRKEYPKTEFFVPGKPPLPDLSSRKLLDIIENPFALESSLMSVGINPPLYRNDRGIWITAMIHYPFMCGNRELLEAYRTAEGSAVCFWWIYNEDAGHNHTATGWESPGLNGNEPSGRNSMLDAVLSMAASDPVMMFVRTGTLTHGYPQYVREFALAYRALPAIRSEILPYPGDSSITIRMYPAGNRKYIAVINTSASPEKKLVAFPQRDIGAGRLKNLVTGKIIPAENGVFRIEAESVSLNSFITE